MDRAEAAAILNIDPSASREDALDAYHALFNEHQVRLNNAPTATLRSRYLEHLRELDEAREALLEGSKADDPGDLPTDQPSFAGKSVVGREVSPSIAAPVAAQAGNVATQRTWKRAVVGVTSLLLIAVVWVLFFYKPSGIDADYRSSGRLELALVTTDTAKQTGPALHSYGDSSKTYGIERDLTSPGDIEHIGTAVDASERPSILLQLSNASVGRINAIGVLDREIALVLDGRSVLGTGIVRAPFQTHMEISGPASKDEITRLLSAVSLSPR